jgi:hypothetical protein
MSKQMKDLVQQDWNNRDLIEGISTGIQDLTNFLSLFGMKNDDHTDDPSKSVPITIDMHSQMLKPNTNSDQWNRSYLEWRGS